MNDTLDRGLLGRVLQREAARWWWAPLVAAVAWFAIAWLVLRANYTSLTTVGVLLGIAFLIAAINEAGLGAVMRGGWTILHYALAVIFVLGAIWAFVHPVNSVFALASVLGLLLFLQGIFTVTRGLAMRDESPYWWLDATAGGLLIALAIWISTSDRDVGPRGPRVLHPGLGRVHGDLPGSLGRRAGLLAPAARHAGHPDTAASGRCAAGVRRHGRPPHVRGAATSRLTPAVP